MARLRPPEVRLGNTYRMLALESYYDAEAAAEQAGLRPVDHQAALRELLSEVQTGIPFPNNIVNGNPLYSPAHEVVDVEPREFQIAMLIDKLQWVTRLHLVKGAGSVTKRPELFASRGRSLLLVTFLCAVAEKPLVTGHPASVVQSGSCGQNASLNMLLANSLNEEILQEMGISLELAKMFAFDLYDHEKDHRYVVLHRDRGPLFFTQGVTDAGSPGPLRFSSDWNLQDFWSLDSHQFYPMVSRFDRSTYNDVEAAEVLCHSPLADERPGVERPLVNLERGRFVRNEMNRLLDLGENGLEKALTEDFRRQKGIRSKFVDKTVLQQNVSHYAQVDKSHLYPASRQKFERKVMKIEREVERKLMKRTYKDPHFEESWVGLCLPENPAAVYRCTGSGQMLAPTVPPRYLERTERIRWAYDTWKRLRPEVDALDRRNPFTLRRTRFEIPPAVEAIESMPFLGALAGARALNYSHNSAHLQMLEGYGQAFSTLDEWIARMGAELADKPDTIDQVRKVGLGQEVHESLSQVQHNLQAFVDLVNKFGDEAKGLPADDAVKARIDELRERVQCSPGWGTIDSLVKAFDPSVRSWRSALSQIVQRRARS